MSRLLIALALILIQGCAGFEMPGQAQQLELVRLMNEGKQIMDRSASTPNEKRQQARTMLTHSGAYDILAADPYSTPIHTRRAAIDAAGMERQYAAVLFKEAAGEFYETGNVAEARETYWEILRTFTGAAYSSLRLKAQTELNYLDEKSKQSIPTSQPVPGL